MIKCRYAKARVSVHLPGLDTVHPQGCFHGNGPRHPPSSLTKANWETPGCNSEDKQRENLPLAKQLVKHKTGRCVHLHVERQADEMRQAHCQVKLHPGGAEPGQRRHGHRPKAEAEGQESRRPEAGRRERPLYRCDVHTVRRVDIPIFGAGNDQ